MDQEKLMSNLSNHAFTFGLGKSKAESDKLSKMERSLYMSQFQNRGYYREIQNNSVLDKIKD